MAIAANRDERKNILSIEEGLEMAAKLDVDISEKVFVSRPTPHITGAGEYFVKNDSERILFPWQD